MSHARLSVSVIGTGRMGSAMARVLSGAGHHLTLWNRNAESAQSLAADLGANTATTPGEAAAASDFILSSLADDRALREVYLGPEGVAAGIRSGGYAIDTSTVDPETVKEIGRAIDEAGSHFLDAPVSGSVSTVEQGALTVMVGGDVALLPYVEPILAPLASRIIHVGPRGAGSATKLAVNALVHGLNVALSEALVLAEKSGVSRSVAYEVFASGAGGAPFVHYKRDAYEHPDTAAVAFSLNLVAKDLELITGLARRVGAPMAQAESGLGVVQSAIEAGMGERDLSAIAVMLRGEI